MRSSKLVREFAEGRVPVYFIPEDRQIAAAYYRNTITHYFLAAAMAEVAPGDRRKRYQRDQGKRAT